MKYLPILLLCGISSIQASPYIDEDGFCVFHTSENERTAPLEGDITLSTTRPSGFRATCTWFGDYDPQPERDALWFQDTGPCIYFDQETAYYSTNVINIIQPLRYDGRTRFTLSCVNLQPLF